MRVKGGTVTRRRHKKLLKRAEGYYGAKSRLFRKAHEQVMKSLHYAFRDRRQRKRDFRRLWITRISAACRAHGIRYNEFIHALHEKGIELNRKQLAEMAVHDPEAFTMLVQSVR
ncbi:MAG: 50S ribosomal protein L20 [Fimbriimonadales bacterium]|jgi:large subunit ribosomal protein L20|nr:50S ribosomal protein L20 [Armatimonadota bacterium]MCX7688793.1 50S ribosomal protein L20 [Fimbriimonadales bacterium]CUU03230.1 LSU ribosomal protein L20P [Armatimonadetes bacterium GBS]CUU34999.1 LSU ribosomal protein L20P [Armatimonadetes bacterium GXS]CUU37062.1 LSU ribosomal protein L20P [Armatimonadetes bacterium DC]GBC90517.1 50S ribosomal protein L20 [bacterium HR14]